MTKQFWADMLERAFKTGVQFTIVEIGALQSELSTSDLGNWTWAIPLLGVVASMVTSFLSRFVGDRDTPSLV